MSKIRVGIMGYGNIGRGTELAVSKSQDMEVAGIFTRRSPETISPITGNIPVYGYEEMFAMSDEIDVMILCGGSASDLPGQTPVLAEYFNVVDSFDTHARIPGHYERVNRAALSSGKVAVISAGWDPGMFSLARVYGEAILPMGESYTFWGPGISQGHSDAIRRIEGVADGRQYTIPVEDAMNRVRGGQNPNFTTREKHKRECYVVLVPGADREKVREQIVTMPDYFSDYDTTVNFISAEEMAENHSRMPHGGSVIRRGTSGRENENIHVIEYSLKLDSNPEFTAGVLAATARAAFRLYSQGISGCKTMLDIPPACYSPRDGAELRRMYL